MIKLLQLEIVVTGTGAHLPGAHILYNGDTLEDVSEDGGRILGVADLSLIAHSPTSQMDSASAAVVFIAESLFTQVTRDSILY